MTKESLYEISKKLHVLKRGSDSFWNTHAFRLAHFADSSPLGLDCRYVQATLKGFLGEQETRDLRKTLIEMRDTINIALEELDETSNN